MTRTMRSLIIVTTLVVMCLTSVMVVHSAATDEEDFYEVLGLGKERDDATERDVKSAWRTLSKKYHPDRAGEAQRETYQRIQRAYEVLGDRKKRKVYDILGAEGVKKFEQPQNQQEQMMNPLMAFFGGGGGHAQGDRGKNEDLLLVVPLEDVYSGAAHTVRLTKTKICRHCRGSGARTKEDLVQCSHCKGHGVVVRRVQLAPGFVQQIEQPCQHCGGKGRIIAAKCPVCKGNQIVQGSSPISIDIEQGISDDHALTFELEANQRPNQVPGDVIVTVKTAPHERFIREGNDLKTTVRLSLKEALLGFDKMLKHLDGHDVELIESGITQHGTRQKIVGEGMPKHHVPSERGDLYVIYEVELPTLLTAAQREVMEHWIG